jgi:hypothetical protein
MDGIPTGIVIGSLIFFEERIGAFGSLAHHSVLRGKLFTFTVLMKSVAIFIEI